MEIDRAVNDFADAARSFCEWAEGPARESHDDMLTAQRHLARLHFLVLSLPDLGLGDDIEDTASAREWKHVRERFQHLPVDGYWDVFDPLHETEPVFGLLSDDLADIYQDLKHGLNLYDRSLIAEAVWEWRFHFDSHWGRHLTSAQRAIYSYFG